MERPTPSRILVYKLFMRHTVKSLNHSQDSVKRNLHIHTENSMSTDFYKLNINVCGLSTALFYVALTHHALLNSLIKLYPYYQLGKMNLKKLT